MDNLLIRKLKFLEFLRVGVGEHEEGRGFSLYVLTRPDCKLSWNKERETTVVYDDQGNPWVRCLPDQNLFMGTLFPELYHDKRAHVPHAYDQRWIKDNFGNGAIIDLIYYPSRLTATIIREALTTDAHLHNNPMLDLGLSRTYPGDRPLTEEKLSYFEAYIERLKPRPQVGKSISPPLSKVRQAEEEYPEHGNRAVSC